MTTISHSKVIGGKTYTFSKLKNGNITVKQGTRNILISSENGIEMGEKVDQILMKWILGIIADWLGK
jgi:hypothetical protein